MTTADLNPKFESLYCKCASHRQIKKLLPTKALKFKISKVPLKQAKPQQMYGILGIRNLSSPLFKMYKAWLIVSFKNHSGGKDWICDGISYATVGLKPVFYGGVFLPGNLGPAPPAASVNDGFCHFSLSCVKESFSSTCLWKNPAARAVIKLKKHTHRFYVTAHVYMRHYVPRCSQHTDNRLHQATHLSAPLQTNCHLDDLWRQYI